MDGYLKDLRTAVGTMPIILNFAVACVFDSQNRILLQARDKELTQWGFPGGALEYGESFAEAAVRECREETGYNVSIDKFLGIYDKYFSHYPNGDAQTIVAAYKATVKGGVEIIDNKETFALQWFEQGEVPQLFHQQHQDIYNDIKKAEL